MRCIVHAISQSRADELAKRLDTEGHAVARRCRGTDEVGDADAATVVLVDRELGVEAIGVLCKRLGLTSGEATPAPMVVTFGGALSTNDAERLARAGVDGDVGALDEGFGARLRFVQRKADDRAGASRGATVEGSTVEGAAVGGPAIVDRGATQVPSLDAEARRVNGALGFATEGTALERLAADRLRMLSALAANVGHEVNNSLVYVMANVRMAKDRLRRHPPREDDDSIELLEEALEGTERIAQIVADLGRFRVTEALSETDVLDVLDACLRMTRSTLRSRVHIVREFHDVPLVRANEARFAQAVLNVLMNVEHAIPTRTSSSSSTSPPPSLPTITITTRASGDHVLIEVRDTGHGIAKEHVDRLFEPFFTTKKDRGHLGLGLSICKALIASQGGDVTVTSDVGRGTTVTLKLPAVPAAVPSAEDPKRQEKGRRRVLVVDDEPFVARSIRDSLGRYDIDIASGGREAIALIDAGPYDAIVCDVMMPGMSGQDLYEELTSRRRGEEARIVFITGGAYTADAASFVAKVKNPCVEKPFDMSALVAAIEDVARAQVARP